MAPPGTFYLRAGGAAKSGKWSNRRETENLEKFEHLLDCDDLPPPPRALFFLGNSTMSARLRFCIWSNCRETENLEKFEHLLTCDDLWPPPKVVAGQQDACSNLLNLQLCTKFIF